MREKFKEPPYPNFDLYEICRRKRQPKPLVQSENAWVSKNPINAAEAVAKIVQGALNKLAPEKYDEIVGTLKTPILLEESTMVTTIDLIFNKALSEPNYSEMYARLCYDMARYEISAQPASPSSESNTERKRSRFREAIVSRAQNEFSGHDDGENRENAKPPTPEELEEAAQRLSKRKKANIKFVGQLFIRRLLSAGIMHRIFVALLRGPSDSPPAVDVEVLCELLETVGKAIDQTEEGRLKMDEHFSKLQLLYGRAEEVYPPRIRFKLMDTLELRKNNWVPRVERIGNQTPATLRQQAATQRRKDPFATNPRSPTVQMTPTRRVPSTMKFPESPNPYNSAAAAAPPANWRSVVAGSSSTQADKDKPTPQAVSAASLHRSESGDSPFTNLGVPSACAVASNSRTNSLSLQEMTAEVFKEWLNDGSDTAVPEWEARFQCYNMLDDVLKNEIVAEVVRCCCLVTRKDAQLEGAGFLVRGLELSKEELLSGLAIALQAAVEEDVLSDTPKFFERFATLLKLCSEDNVYEVYINALVIIRDAYTELVSQGKIEPRDAVEPFLSVWKLLPRVPVDETIVTRVANEGPGEREEGEPSMLVGMLAHLVENRVVPAAAVVQWAESCPERSARVVAALKANGAL